MNTKAEEKEQDTHAITGVGLVIHFSKYANH